jgi:type I restriction enzyme S subunit
MIEDLKPYPQYKDSGLPWLGQVPEHWEIRPASGAFSPIRERNTGMKEKTVLSLSYGRIVVKPAGKLHGLVPESFDTYQIVNPGVTVIRTTDLQNDKTSLRTGIVRDRGIITSAYLALSTSDGLLPEFGYQILNTWDITKAIYGYGSGLRQNLDFSDFRRMPVAVPPIAEQAFIARFLAWATNRLDRAIGAKRRIIALLQEQKQAIIHRAVTRGLDPSVQLKDSGIPWLGEIPVHWEVRRAKYLFREIDDRSARGGEELLSVSHMTGVTPRSQKNITMFKAASYAGHKLCQPGDLVINTMWAWMGALGTSSYSGIISPAYAVYRPRQMTDIIDIYIDFLLRSTPYIANIICQSTGLHTSRLRLYPEAFFRLPIILPPREEQLLIVDKLKGDTADLNTAISRLESEITLLREYRTRLIADVVTGKLDVREVAKGLPEVELQDQPDVAAGYDADEAEDDVESDLVDTAED